MAASEQHVGGWEAPAIPALPTAPAGRADRCAGLVAILICAASGPASPADPQPSEVAAGARLEEVVVTGSRLPVPEGLDALPVTLLDAADLARDGRDSLGRLLQALPQNTGSPLNTNVNNGGDGSTRLSLRGLGPERTLVLLNGRRLPNGGIGGDASVDVDTIPLSLVERVEVLNAGATAIYGADAVAGVVNVITRPAAGGLSIDARQQLATDGDGEITYLRAAGGVSLGEGAWSLGVDWARQDPVLQSARDYSAVPLVLVSPTASPEFRGSFFLPDGTFQLLASNAFRLPPGLYTHSGTVGSRTAADYRLVDFAADGFNFAPYNYLQTPNERETAWLLGTQPFGAVELFVEGLWQQRSSAQKLAPTPFFIAPGSAPMLPSGQTAIPADNWYNPFGVAIPMGSRRFVELDERGSEQEVEAWRALAGLRGTLGAWRWDVAASLARSDSRSREGGLVSSARIVPALGPSGPDAGGRIVCGARDPVTGIVPASAIVPGCVPLNVFGGAGSITREQLDWLSVALFDRGANEQRLLDVGLTGSWGTLPAGPLQWAVGAEYRRESGSYRFDPLRAAGVVSSANTDIPGGSFDARELYAEVRAPLLADRRWAHALDLTIGARLQDYSSFGTSTPWQLGLAWAPVEDLTVRVQHAQVLRAPAIAELYRANAIASGIGARDPCGNNPTPTQRANCAANGVPGGAYLQGPVPIYEVAVGGNPDLRPERGTSSTLGVAWSPPRLAGLRLSLDGYRVDVDGFISVPGEDRLLFECAERGRPEVCARIRRATDGSIVRITTTGANFGRVITEGVDHSGALTFEPARGQLHIEWLASWLHRFDVEVFEDTPPIRAAGTNLRRGNVFPRWRAGLGTDWTRGGWRLAYSVQYIGSLQDCGETFSQPALPYCQDVGAVTYHDVSVAYAFERGPRLRAGVDNLTDTDPPYLNGGGANTDPATYRLLGRTWFVDVGFEWP
jgi:outer membrane receptor protein involved in Fe transport